MSESEKDAWNRDRENAIEEPEELTLDDVLEILAEQEYRLCLMELGVNYDDL